MMPAISSSSRNGEYLTQHRGERDGRDRLLDEPAHLLDHGQPVGGLYTRAFQAIVEDGIFVDRDVEGRGFAHHLDADMVGVAVGQQVVEVVDRSRQNAGDDRQGHLRPDQPPEVLRQRLLQADAVDAVDDEAANDADARPAGRRPRCGW